MARRKKRLGNGASVSVLARYIHPSQPWKDKFVNNYDKARANGLGVIGREAKIIKRKETDCVLLSHIDFPGQVFHVALQRVVVVEEGPESELFGGNDEAQNNRPETFNSSLLWRVLNVFGSVVPHGHLLCWRPQRILVV